VHTFARGADAVLAARAMPSGEGPDVLVIDVMMPDMDGPSTVDALREAGVDARLLWTSGFSPERTRIPPDGRFLQKPYAGTELGQAIRQLLQEAPA
jgi:CheY-like chemotaxis protein